ncbi:hypothetical protein ACXYMX_01670 [Sporosarcina sp. CAU 1771]
MKFISRTFGLLLLINGLLLYMHYSESGSAAPNSGIPLTYSQEIEVMNRQDGLYIRHHFTGLSNGRYELIWPESSVDKACYELDSEACSRIDDQLRAFMDSDTTRQTITYRIPKEAPLDEATLFKNIFTELHGANVKSTIFHITDETGAGGMWVNGMKNVGHKKLDLIEYFLFTGTGKVTDLYWQKEVHQLTFKGNRLSLFGGAFEKNELEKIDELLKVNEVSHSTLVIGNANSPVGSDRFIVAETTELERMTDTFLINSMYSRFELSKEQPIVAEIIASILSGKGTGSDKSRSMYEELSTSLSTEKVSTFAKELREMNGKVLNATILDELIEQITGYGSSYFTRNGQDTLGNYPFMLEDTRKVLVKGIEKPNIRVIIKDGRMLYPAKEVLSSSGYEMNSNEQSLYIGNVDRVFRFPLKELFYVFNERKFSVVVPPFEIIENEYYFEESWLARLFLFDVVKKEDTIDLVSKEVN